jgi:hypothetical protein
MAPLLPEELNVAENHSLECSPYLRALGKQNVGARNGGGESIINQKKAEKTKWENKKSKSHVVHDTHTRPIILSDRRPPRPFYSGTDGKYTCTISHERD